MEVFELADQLDIPTSATAYTLARNGWPKNGLVGAHHLGPKSARHLDMGWIAVINFTRLARIASA